MKAGDLIKALQKVPPEREVEMHWRTNGGNITYQDEFGVYSYEGVGNFAWVSLDATQTGALAHSKAFEGRDLLAEDDA